MTDVEPRAVDVSGLRNRVDDFLADEYDSRLGSGGEKTDYLRETVEAQEAAFDLWRIHDALLSRLSAAEARAAADKARLDWLEHMDVNVRVPLVHGSRDLFWASPDQEEGQDEPSDIRARIDAALTSKGPDQ